VLERMANLSVGVVQKKWPGGRDQAKAEEACWNDFITQYAEPALKLWRQHRYEKVLRAVQPATAIYERLRHDLGRLNYQDLLMKAAGLLRSRPNVRRYFRKRFTHLLVDEFQDTDPVQAEVMLLLTADDGDQTDWRQCRPVPGSLFVVGDPKQSIYRFRRADIVTYNQVRDIIQANDGLVVRLWTNFRSAEPVVEWVNGVFDKVLPSESTVYSPANVPLETGRTEAAKGDLRGVYALRIPGELTRQEKVIAYDADFIARFIRKALDGAVTLARSDKELWRHPASPPGRLPDRFEHEEADGAIRPKPSAVGYPPPGHWRQRPQSGKRTGPAAPLPAGRLRAGQSGGPGGGAAQ
jgi:ATP-dependent helicase/nuclease subunit A